MSNFVSETALIKLKVFSNLYSQPDDGRQASPETQPR